MCSLLFPILEAIDHRFGWDGSFHFLRWKVQFTTVGCVLYLWNYNYYDMLFNHDISLEVCLFFNGSTECFWSRRLPSCLSPLKYLTTQDIQSLWWSAILWDTFLVWRNCCCLVSHSWGGSCLLLLDISFLDTRSCSYHLLSFSSGKLNTPSLSCQVCCFYIWRLDCLVYPIGLGDLNRGLLLFFFIFLEFRNNKQPLRIAVRHYTFIALLIATVFRRICHSVNFAEFLFIGMIRDIGALFEYFSIIFVALFYSTLMYDLKGKRVSKSVWSS